MADQTPLTSTPVPSADLAGQVKDLAGGVDPFDALSKDEGDQLRSAIKTAEAGDVSTPLPRLSKAQLFIIGVMNSIDPHFARNIGGPLLRRDAEAPEKDREAEQARLERQVERAKTSVTLSRQEAADKRAQVQSDIQAAREQDRVEDRDIAQQEKDEQKEILKDSISGEMDNFALSRENAFRRAENYVRTAEQTRLPSLANFARGREAFIRGQFAEMQALMEGAIHQGPDAGFFELPDNDAFLAQLQEFGQQIEDTLTETDELILDAGLKADAARAAAAGSDVPASIKEKLADLDLVEISLNELERFQEQFPDVGGPGGQAVGVFQGTFGRIFNTKENFDTKNAFIAEVATTLIKMKSGSQVTESEFERIKPMLPAINLTDAENLNRIRNLRRFLVNNISTIETRFNIIDALPPDVVKDMSPEEKDALFNGNESTRFKNWNLIEIPDDMEVEASDIDTTLSNVEPPTGAGALPSDDDRRPGEGILAFKARQQERGRSELFKNLSAGGFSITGRVEAPSDTISLEEAARRRRKGTLPSLRSIPPPPVKKERKK